MSAVGTPYFEYEILGEGGMRASVKFHEGFDEVLFVDSFPDATGINWTTGLSAFEVPKVIQGVLPEPAEVEVWHWNARKVFSSDETGRILDAIKAEDTIRMTYAIEPNEIACKGLFVAWRIPVEGESRFNRLGVLIDSPECLDVPNNLIDVTATRHIKSVPHLLYSLIGVTRYKND